MNHEFDQKISQQITSWQQIIKNPENTSPLGVSVAFFLDQWKGLHHLDQKQLSKTDWTNEDFIEVFFRGVISTFDADELTRLVLLSHDLKLRVELSAHNLGLFKMYFHRRKERSGHIWSRMPFIEDHLEDLRKDWGFPSLTSNQPKTQRSAKSSNPLSLEQAVEILNAGEFITKETKQITNGSPIIWKVQNEDQVAAYLKTDETKPIDFIRRATAIHRARQFIRRAPEISAFRERINEILGINQEETK